MNLLLDTHAFMWFVNGDPNLGKKSKKINRKRKKPEILQCGEPLGNSCQNQHRKTFIIKTI